MKQFFISLLATITGIILSTIIMFLILVGVVAGIASSSSNEKEVKVKPNSVLQINFENGIAERSSKNPLKDFDFGSLSDNKKLGMDEILNSIENAKTDENIKGICLDMTSIPAGIATVEEIRNALVDFKKSDKFIMSYADAYTQGSYYLASAGDKIYMNPQGMLQWTGLNAEVSFYKGTLEKLDLEMQIFRHGKFKSAIEPLTSDKMSPANREQMTRLLTSVWDHLLGNISEQRNISIDELNKLADDMTIQTAKDAVDHKLIDGAIYADEFEKIVKDKIKAAEKDKLNYVKLSAYAKKEGKKGYVKSKDKVAVIYAVGSIGSGEGDEESIGSEGLSKAIREARLDDNVKAIVLRINSPGGSSLASDIIWRETVLAKEKKPVIVSMGDVAASGGYYIACAADKIYAQPNTITGSIGVFGVIPNLEKFLNNKLGVTIDRVSTNKHSGVGSITRAADEQEKAVIQHLIEEIYTTFITNVAQGRKMTTAQVDSIGQGRVWTGVDAKLIGLVDELGGLDDAIAMAVKKANLKEYKLELLPKQKDPFQEIMKGLSGDVESKIEARLGEQYMLYKQMQQVMSWKGMQTRLPFDLIIK